MTDVFVFGSNLAGRHGKGAALFALRNHGAKYGLGIGRQGDSYAIPTKGFKLEVLPLLEIESFILEFICYAKTNPDLTFNVTRIGCGLAGYKDEQIAPLFDGAPTNCKLPEGWREIISGHV